MGARGCRQLPSHRPGLAWATAEAGDGRSSASALCGPASPLPTRRHRRRRGAQPDQRWQRPSAVGGARAAAGQGRIHLGGYALCDGDRQLAVMTPSAAADGSSRSSSRIPWSIRASASSGVHRAGVRRRRVLPPAEIEWSATARPRAQCNQSGGRRSSPVASSSRCRDGARRPVERSGTARLQREVTDRDPAAQPEVQAGPRAKMPSWLDVCSPSAADHNLKQDARHSA